MTKTQNPRILLVTPETTYLPEGMGNLANAMTAKAGGLADVSASLISALFNEGADVHVAMPDYRAMFENQMEPILRKQRHIIRSKVPHERVHLAEDRAFFYLHHVYSSYGWENMRISLAFHREVMNHIVPSVRPDLIHCNDWMTALVPAMSRQMEIPCLFTTHNIHTVKTTLAHIEDRGIDAAYFWDHLYFDYMAEEYETARETNPVDFLTSGVFAAHFVNTVSPTFLKEIVDGHHNFVFPSLRRELTNKWHAGCAVGILNSPDPSFNPATDRVLIRQYGPDDHLVGKIQNKRYIQKSLGLVQNDNAPLFFWPSRLDNSQKGCQLMAEILYNVIDAYWDEQLEIVFVANGAFKQVFRDIVDFHGIEQRVAVCDFDERLSRMAYAGSAFILMPSLFEPCGLPQMIAPIYGSLPVARDTGGIHDTITHLDLATETGNGFLFEHYDSNGLFWAIGEAMAFYGLPLSQRQSIIQRVMNHALQTFNHTVTARQYMDLYERMLERPLIN